MRKRGGARGACAPGDHPDLPAELARERASVLQGAEGGYHEQHRDDLHDHEEDRIVGAVNDPCDEGTQGAEPAAAEHVGRP